MNVTRKPRLLFDEGVHPSGLTFDDGAKSRRNLPWSHFRCAEWCYEDPTSIRMEMGDWQVVISGHNLAGLFEAIESERLIRVQAHPEFVEDSAHENDVFATSIRFIHLTSAGAAKGGGPAQLQFAF
jgi:hypothetical protein